LQPRIAAGMHIESSLIFTDITTTDIATADFPKGHDVTDLNPV